MCVVGLDVIVGYKSLRLKILGLERNLTIILLGSMQYDPETSNESVRYHGPPQVMLAYLKYQWSLGEDLKRKEAFAGLQV